MIAISSNIDISNVDNVIFTISGATKLIKVYPGNVSYSDGIFGIPLNQEDTIALSNNVKTRCAVEGQINFKNKAVAKTENAFFNLEPTYNTQIVEGNTPSAEHPMVDVSLKVEGNVIIASISGDVTPEQIASAVEKYITEHPDTIVSKAYLENTIKDFITADALDDYSTKTEVSDAVNTLAISFAESLGNYYTKTEVDDAIESAIGGALNGTY